MPRISFILPIFNEEDNLPKLWSELQNLETQIVRLNLQKNYSTKKSEENKEFQTSKSNDLESNLEKSNSEILQNFSLEKKSVKLLANSESLENNLENLTPTISPELAEFSLDQNDSEIKKSQKINLEIDLDQKHDLESSLIQDRFECEFVFVNDGSVDKSWQILKDIYTQNSQKVKIINFSRNFGHQIAVSCGQNETSSDAVIIMDTDLQDPPLVCLDLIHKWQEGFDIVFAQRKKYKTNFIKEISAFVFYRLMAKIAQVEIPIDTGDFRLISGRVNEEMKKYPEKNRFLRGISCLVGFQSSAVQFDRSERFAGKPGYSFAKSLKLAIDGLTSFSLFPIRLVSLTGLFFAIFGFLFGFIYIIWSVWTHKTSDGWASLMFVIIFLGGIQLLMLGILGEYIGRIFTEVLGRPLYTIAEKLEPVKNK